jgi:thymidine phosphorylase
MACSGTIFRRPGVLTADVASTGGPSSLSTLLCPLFLRAAGLEVPKLGVPGRPAGGIDCLLQIVGYRAILNDVQLAVAMDEAGYAHFLASGRYAPMDARVFKLRQQHGFQEVPTLVAASLLSKKLAVGVLTAGLDVRVAPHGNFGKTMAEAQENAELFAQAARLLGISARPLLTDGSVPYQSYIGRSEALAALDDVFSGVADRWLLQHVETCRRLAMAAVPAESASLIEKSRAEDLYRAFLGNIVAQGTNEIAFKNAVTKVRGANVLELRAAADGEVQVSLELIRRALVAAQVQAATVGQDYPDPAGLILRKRPGSTARKGEVLAVVRIDIQTMQRNLIQALSKAITVGNGGPK